MNKVHLTMSVLNTSSLDFWVDNGYTKKIKSGHKVSWDSSDAAWVTYSGQPVACYSSDEWQIQGNVPGVGFFVSDMQLNIVNVQIEGKKS